MAQTVFDSPGVRSAMRGYLAAAEKLDTAAELGGGEPRDLLDAAEAKTLAGLQLRKALEREGWTAPSREAAASADVTA